MFWWRWSSPSSLRGNVGNKPGRSPLYCCLGRQNNGNISDTDTAPVRSLRIWCVLATTMESWTPVRYIVRFRGTFPSCSVALSVLKCWWCLVGRQWRSDDLERRAGLGLHSDRNRLLGPGLCQAKPARGLLQVINLNSWPHIIHIAQITQSSSTRILVCLQPQRQ